MTETVITVSSSDDAGNASSSSFTLTVINQTPLSITCPADIMVQNDNGLCSAQVLFANPVTSDACSTVSVIRTDSSGLNSGDQFPIGITTITYMATDEAGNTSYCGHNIVVENTEAPVVSGIEEDSPVVNEACQYQLSDYAALLTISDDCTALDELLVTQSPAAGIMMSGSTTVIITFTDASGNSTDHIVLVESLDETAPTILSAHNDIMQDIDADCEYVLEDFTSSLSATDNCSSDLIITQDPLPGAVLSESGVQTMVTLTVEDESGNENSVSFMIEIFDSEPILISCPSDTLVPTPTVGCEVYFTLDKALELEGCQDLTPINDFNNTDDASGLYGLGNTIVTWTVFDAQGNSATCIQQVTVQDVVAPGIESMENQFLETLDCSYEIPDLTSMVQATDNCTAFEDLVITQNPSSGTAQGITYLEFVVTDASGNTSISGVELIPIDDTAPVLDCPGLAVEYLEDGECESLVNVPGPVVVEECGTVTISNSFNGAATLSALFTEGIHDIIWIVTDQSGNTSSCTVALSVINPIQAAVSCPDDISVIQNLDECGMYLDIEIPEVQGLCAYELTNDFTGTNDASAIYGPGVHTVTYTAIGYVQATCSFEIEVLDIIAPELDCPEAVSQCGFSVTLGLPSVLESCELSSLTNDFNGLENASGTYPDGTTLVTWTATDSSGNVGTCTTSVVVSDPGEGMSAGPDDVIEYAFNYIMQGHMATSASGTWTAQSEDVIFTDPSNPNSMVNGLGLGENVLTWTVDNGPCGILTDEVIIEVRQFLIPTGFSPNGDGVNDDYVIRGIENLGKTSMEVYDRWGKRIYQNEAYDNSWNGASHSGRILPTDTYFIIITIEETGAVIKSTIELKR